MSGHSKWHKIKHKKAATDSKKSQMFGKISREIAALARRNADPAQNPSLRDAIERAKKANVPQENIDRLLAREADAASAVVYEGYGPGGAAVLVMVVTDNTNRTVAEMRSMFKKHGGSMGAPNSVRWKFAPRAKVMAEVNPNVNMEDLELELIDKGATDFVVENNEIIAIGEPSSRDKLEEALEDKGLTITESEIEHHVPDEQRTKLSDEQLTAFNAFIEELLEHPDVREAHSDIA